MSTGKVTPIVPPSAQPLRELSPAHQRDQRDPLLRRYSARVRSLGADPKGACLEMGDMIPVVPHKAVAEVSKIGNL